MIALFYLLTQDPTFNGRTTILIDYIQAWLQLSLFGMRTNGILSHPEQFTHQHGHNYYIDILTGRGIIGFTVTIITLAVPSVVVFKSSREIRPWIGAR
jgi:O-antigen ligase